MYHLRNCSPAPSARKESEESDPRTSLYFTTRVSGIVDVAVPEVAVTVKVYVPAGVPFGLGCDPPVLPPPMVPPPPQEMVNSNRANGVSFNQRRPSRLDRLLRGQSTRPSAATDQFAIDQAQGVGLDPGGRTSEMVRDVVLIVRSKSVATVALTATVAGSLQVAPRGAPVQLSVAVPLIPSPPMARL